MAVIPLTRIALKKEHTDDRQQNQIQDNAYDSGKVLNTFPIAFGRMLAEDDRTTFDLAFTAGQTRTFSHGLRRNPTGFIVIDASGTAGYPSLRRSTTDDLTIALQSANACTVKVWVY